MKHINQPFAIITFSIFLVLLLPLMLQEGLFMDGLIYSSVAQNLANENGSVWNLQFSETILKNFHEHPPLTFLIQAGFFKVFGSFFWVEKLYSFLSALLSAFLIIKIWKRLSTKNIVEANLYWLPVLFWITTPHVFWSFNNNMLENTMELFNLAAIFLLIISDSIKIKKQIFLIFLASLFICLAALSKGLPAFFPLVFFIILWITTKDLKLSQSIVKSILVWAFTIILLSLLLISNEEAFQSIRKYFDNQVILSLEGGSRIIHRKSHIFEKLFIEIAGMALISIIIISVKLKANIKLLKKNPIAIRSAILFFLIGFSASAPLMISPKQSTFYLVPSIPYFAIGFSIFLSAIISKWISGINLQSKLFSFFRYLAIFIFISVLTHSFSRLGNSYRDKTYISDIKTIGNNFNDNSTFSISKSLFNDWTLISYGQRYHYFNFERSGELLQYHIIKTGEVVPNNYYILEEFNLNNIEICTHK